MNENLAKLRLLPRANVNELLNYGTQSTLPTEKNKLPAKKR